MSIETVFRTVTISMPADVDRTTIEQAVVQTARENGLRCTRSGVDSDFFHLTIPKVERTGLISGLLRRMRGHRS